MPALRSRYDQERHPHSSRPYPDRQELSAQDRRQNPVRSPLPAHRSVPSVHDRFRSREVYYGRYDGDHQTETNCFGRPRRFLDERPKYRLEIDNDNSSHQRETDRFGRPWRQHNDESLRRKRRLETDSYIPNHRIEPDSYNSYQGFDTGRCSPEHDFRPSDRFDRDYGKGSGRSRQLPSSTNEFRHWKSSDYRRSGRFRHQSPYRGVGFRNEGTRDKGTQTDLSFGNGQAHYQGTQIFTREGRTSYKTTIPRGARPIPPDQLEKLDARKWPQAYPGWGFDSAAKSPIHVQIGASLQNPPTSTYGGQDARFAKYAPSPPSVVGIEPNTVLSAKSSFDSELTPVVFTPPNPSANGNDPGGSSPRFVVTLQDRKAFDKGSNAPFGGPQQQPRLSDSQSQQTLNPATSVFTVTQGISTTLSSTNNDLTSYEGTRRSARLANQQQRLQYSSSAQINEPQALPAQPKTAPKGPKKSKEWYGSKAITPPNPSREYLQKSGRWPTRLAQPRSLLVILDLNGALIHRGQKGGSAFSRRPRVKEFLHYLFEHHAVMIWSSARRVNVVAIVEQLLEPQQRNQLIDVWAREQFGLPDWQFNNKVQVYKKLSLRWNTQTTKAMNGEHVWSQADTVLIDDSAEKARSEPFNLIQVEEFVNRPDQQGTDVLGQVVRYLEVLSEQADVSAYIKHYGAFTYDPYAAPFDWSDIELQMAFDKQIPPAEAAERSQQ